MADSSTSTSSDQEQDQVKQEESTSSSKRMKSDEDNAAAGGTSAIETAPPAAPTAASATKKWVMKLISADHEDICNVKTPLFVVNEDVGYLSWNKDYVPTQDELDDKLSQNVAKLTKQLLSWRPEWNDSPWFAFRVSAKEIERMKFTPASFSGKSAAEFLVFDILGVPSTKTRQLEVKITPVKNSRKTAWPQRFYFSDGRVHTKALAKVKAATNQLYASCVKDSISIVKFYTEDRAWYWPPVLLVGYSKAEQGAGGLFGVLYEDTDQEHLHHGY